MAVLKCKPGAIFYAKPPDYQGNFVQLGVGVQALQAGSGHSGDYHSCCFYTLRAPLLNEEIRWRHPLGPSQIPVPLGPA